MRSIIIYSVRDAAEITHKLFTASEKNTQEVKLHFNVITVKLITFNFGPQTYQPPLICGVTVFPQGPLNGSLAAFRIFT